MGESAVPLPLGREFLQDFITNLLIKLLYFMNVSLSIIQMEI